MIFYFQSPSAAAFMDDLDQFTDEASFPRLPLSDEDGTRRIPSVALTGSTRIDFDVIENLVAVPAVTKQDRDGNTTVVTPAVTRGWHCNVMLSERDPRKPTGTHLAVGGAVKKWFLNKTKKALKTPATVKTRYRTADRSVPTTARASKLIDPAPAIAKRIWAR